MKFLPSDNSYGAKVEAEAGRYWQTKLAVPQSYISQTRNFLRVHLCRAADPILSNPYAGRSHQYAI